MASDEPENIERKEPAGFGFCCVAELGVHLAGAVRAQEMTGRGMVVDEVVDLRGRCRTRICPDEHLKRRPQPKLKRQFCRLQAISMSSAALEAAGDAVVTKSSGREREANPSNRNLK
jgi:hypothetical protein